MNEAKNNKPLLLLSQDYELFFHQSGSIEKCLLEPTKALREFARRSGVKVSLYVDAGMLSRMRSYADSVKELSRDFDQLRRDIETMAKDGHEIGLHVHPHWEDTVWQDGSWMFTNTRYSPGQFSRNDLMEIFRNYASELADITGDPPTSYRAGGFCLKPFDVVGEALRSVNIFTDSSVVPGARLNDSSKGFDFRGAPDRPFWFFDDDPIYATESGRFLEIPVATTHVSFFYYWKRLATRLTGQQPPTVFGDGMSKRIGAFAAAKRLLGMDRLVEMSIDVPKVEHLPRGNGVAQTGFCHVMGHPKLLSRESLERLDNFISDNGIQRFETVSSAAQEIRHGSLFPD